MAAIQPRRCFVEWCETVGRAPSRQARAIAASAKVEVPLEHAKGHRETGPEAWHGGGSPTLQAQVEEKQAPGDAEPEVERKRRRDRPPPSSDTEDPKRRREHKRAAAAGDNAARSHPAVDVADWIGWGLRLVTIKISGHVARVQDAQSTTREVNMDASNWWWLGAPIEVFHLERKPKIG